MANNSSSSDNLRQLSQGYFELAKNWWRFGIFYKTLVFITGIGSTLLVVFTNYAPFLAAVLEIISEICLWRSDALKDSAEELLRKLDARDSFGWEISNAELSDLLVKVPNKLEKLAPPETREENYFASQTTAGSRRSLENIQESAWWSKHLARRMFNYCLVISILLFAVVLVTLIIAIQTVANSDVLVSIGRVVTSSLMLFFALGLYRRVIAYYEFSQKCSQIESRIEVLLSGESPIIESEAIKIMYEYQIARFGSPLLASFVWRSMRKKLNEMWEKYRQQRPVS